MARKSKTPKVRKPTKKEVAETLATFKALYPAFVASLQP